MDHQSQSSRNHKAITKMRVDLSPRSLFQLANHPINGNQCQSMSINVNQCQSMSINVNQCQSMSINGNQRQSTAINGNQWQSTYLSPSSFWSLQMATSARNVSSINPAEVPNLIR